MIDASFGEKYAELKEMERKFSTHYGNISFNFTTPHNVKTFNPLTFINETSQKINSKIDEKASYTRRTVRLVRNFMILIYFIMVYGESELSEFESKLIIENLHQQIQLPSTMITSEKLNSSISTSPIILRKSTTVGHVLVAQVFH